MITDDDDRGEQKSISPRACCVVFCCVDSSFFMLGLVLGLAATCQGPIGPTFCYRIAKQLTTKKEIVKWALLL